MGEGGTVPLNQFLRHCEEKHRLNRSVSTATDGSFVQSWPVDDAAMGRRFQNWFISPCTRASYDGNVLSRGCSRRTRISTCGLSSWAGRTTPESTAPKSPLATAAVTS